MTCPPKPAEQRSKDDLSFVPFSVPFSIARLRRKKLNERKRKGWKFFVLGSVFLSKRASSLKKAAKPARILKSEMGVAAYTEGLWMHLGGCG